MGIMEVIGAAFQGIVKPILDKFIPDANARLQAEQAIMQAFNKVGQDMRDLLKLDAVSGDKFQSRWRPALGWVCVFSYAWTYVFQPFVMFFLTLLGKTVALPELDQSELTALLGALLGIGAMRSYEKVAQWKNGDHKP